MNLAALWLAVWPNLAADCIWVPLVWGWHHSRLDRKLDQQRAHIMRDLRKHLQIEDS